MTFQKTAQKTFAQLTLAAALAVGVVAVTSQGAQAAGCLSGWSLVTTNTSFYCQREIRPSCGIGTVLRRNISGNRDKCTGGLNLGGNNFSVELNPGCAGSLRVRTGWDRCRQRAEPLPFL